MPLTVSCDDEVEKVLLVTRISSHRQVRVYSGKECLQCKTSRKSLAGSKQTVLARSGSGNRRNREFNCAELKK